MKLRVETSQTIGRPVEQVFDAWVDPGKMAGYFISRSSGRMEAGRTVSWTWDDYGGMQLDVDVKTVEPGRELAFDWSVGDAPTRVEVEFEALTDDTTRVTVREGEWNADAAGIARYGSQMQGWVHMLACLKAYLEYEKINLRQTPTGAYGLETQRVMKAKPADLYRALTLEWDRWFGVRGAIEIRAGAESPFWFDAIGENERVYPHYGRFLRLEPDRGIELTWVTAATRGAETRLSIELAPEADGTRLDLSHTGFYDEAAMKGHEVAWPGVLVYLDECLAKSFKVTSQDNQ
jgi:uncharacterized protein YndB with AHSA1/START domain